MGCDAWRIIAGQMYDENKPLPLASHCRYLEKKEIRPLMSGCPNNDFCPSWFGNLFCGYGDAANKGPDTMQTRDLVAQETYSDWKENFARNYFKKRPVTTRHESEGFWHKITQDFFSDVESVESPSTAPSNVGDDTVHDTLGTTMLFRDDEGTQQETIEANGERIVSSDNVAASPETDPEDLLYGDVNQKSCNEEVENPSNEVESNSSGAKNATEEDQELVTLTWTCTYPIMDIGRDSDFLD